MKNTKTTRTPSTRPHMRHLRESAPAASPPRGAKVTTAAPGEQSRASKASDRALAKAMRKVDVDYQRGQTSEKAGSRIIRKT